MPSSTAARRAANGARARIGGKVAESVAREIVLDVARQRLAPGARLPSEAHMVAHYGIARGSLREALRILEVLGLIRMKAGPGGGPVVRGVSAQDFARTARLYFQLGTMTFRDTIDARLVLEPVMARRAAERRDPQLVRELLASCTPAGGDEAYLHASTQFHRLIAAMSGNGILDLFNHSLQGIFHDSVRGILFPRSQRGMILATHAAIAKAISRGEATKAERLMRLHMHDYVKHATRHYGEQLDEVVDWR